MQVRMLYYNLSLCKILKHEFLNNDTSGHIILEDFAKIVKVVQKLKKHMKTKK